MGDLGNMLPILENKKAPSHDMIDSKSGKDGEKKWYPEADKWGVSKKSKPEDEKAKKIHSSLNEFVKELSQEAEEQGVSAERSFSTKRGREPELPDIEKGIPKKKRKKKANSELEDEEEESKKKKSKKKKKIKDMDKTIEEFLSG